MELRDRVVMVTGGGGGIGASLCRRFHQEGARLVVVVDVDGDAAAAVAGEVGGEPHQLDAAGQEEVHRLVGSVVDAHGGIDLLCANAGIASGGGIDLPQPEWQQAWEVNLMSQVYAAQAVLPHMLTRGDGYLLLTSSAAGLLTSLDSVQYTVTKHASVALAEWLSIAYHDAGIRVSCLAPQFVNTPMADIASTTPEAAAFVQSVLIEPETVAAAVVAALAEERFLVLPHPEVSRYFAAKAADPDRWLAGMRGLRRELSPEA